MREKDGPDDEPHNHSICPMVGTMEKAQVANQQSDLEETDAKLVDRPASKIDSGVCDEIFLGSQADGKAKAISRFCSDGVRLEMSLKVEGQSVRAMQSTE